MEVNQAKVVDKYIDHKQEDEEREDSDTDSLTDLLDTIDDEFLAQNRQKRLEELQREFNQVDYSVNQGIGLKDVTKEHELMNFVTAHDLVIIHFYQENFAKCNIVNSLLAQLAQRHLGPLWLSINVKNAPFLVEKLQIKVLPCIVVYKKANLWGKILGYEFVRELTLGYTPNAQDLESYLVGLGVLTRNSGKLPSGPAQLKQEDSEDDLDI